MTVVAIWVLAVITFLNLFALYQASALYGEMIKLANTVSKQAIKELLK